MFPPMQEMSFWQVVENSPEWVGVIANTLFAIVTIGVVVWQGRVMLTDTDHHPDLLLDNGQITEVMKKIKNKPKAVQNFLHFQTCAQV